jgi:hypothetical protein
MVILQVFNKCLTHKKVGRSHTDLGFSDAISIPSKFCYSGFKNVCERKCDVNFDV